jgi:predicted DNA-binding transcriptional regulator AlpA
VTGRRMTLREIRQLPATVDVPTAAGALGIGKSTLYEAIKLGASPVKVIIVQRRVLVLTADLVRILEGGSGDASAA